MANPDPPEEVADGADDPVSRIQALLDEIKGAKDKDEPGGEFKGKTIRDAEQEAYTRVRAHNRRKRETTTQAPGA